MMLIAVLLVLAGFACLALSMRKHHVQVRGHEPGRWTRLVWGALAWSLLAFALVPCATQEGVAVGIVTWTGFSTVGAMVVALVLTYCPRKLVVLAVGAPLLALAVLALG